MSRLALFIGVLLLVAAPLLFAAHMWYVDLMAHFPIPGPEPKPDMSVTMMDIGIGVVACGLVAVVGLSLIYYSHIARKRAAEPSDAVDSRQRRG